MENNGKSEREGGNGSYRRLPLTIATIGIFSILLVGALWFGRPFFLPATAALVLTLMMAPVVTWLRRRGLPETVGALFAVIGFCLALQVAIGGFVVPLSTWLGRAPQIVANLEQRLEDVTKPIKSVSEITARVNKSAKKDGGEKVQKVEVKKPSFMEAVLASTPDVLVQLGLVIVLLYFMLANHGTFRRRLILVQSQWADKLRVARIVQEVEATSSTYLFTITTINIGLGIAVGLALWGAGMPDPILWGVMMAILNFIPYIGPLAVTACVAAVALAEIPPLWLALLQPAIVFVLHLIEAVFVTPSVLGKRLSLNPMIVIVNLSFWGWLWGPIGAMVSVPMLLVVGVLCSHIERLAPLNLFITDREPRETREGNGETQAEAQEF